MRPRGGVTRFAIVRPRGDRNFENHTVSITFAIDEARAPTSSASTSAGNTRTRDYVIRANSISRKATPTTARWSIAPNAG